MKTTILTVVFVLVAGVLAAPAQSVRESVGLPILRDAFVGLLNQTYEDVAPTFDVPDVPPPPPPCYWWGLCAPAAPVYTPYGGLPGVYPYGGGHAPYGGVHAPYGALPIDPGILLVDYGALRERIRARVAGGWR